MNVYEEAYKIQNQLIDLVAQKQQIEAMIKDLNDEKERLIARGNDSPKMGEYNLIVKRKTTEKRKINMDALKRNKPWLLVSCGTISAELAGDYLSPTERYKLINDPKFDKAYKIGLGELDKACGGKKESAEFCEVEITEKVERGISRLREPIIEV